MGSKITRPKTVFRHPITQIKAQVGKPRPGPRGPFGTGAALGAIGKRPQGPRQPRP